MNEIEIKPTTVMRAVLFSGGMDSTALLMREMSECVRHDKFGSVLPIAFRIGTIQEKAEDAARERVWEAVRALFPGDGARLLPIHYVDMKDAFRHSLSALSTGEGIVDGEYSVEAHKAYNIAFRNGVYISVATSIVEEYLLSERKLYNKYQEFTPTGYVSIGIHARNNSDEKPYIDCTEEFASRIHSLTSVSTYSKVGVRAPFVQRTKRGIVDWIVENFPTLGLNVLELSVSCYHPTDNNEPCGKCPTCLERIESMQKYRKSCYEHRLSAHSAVFVDPY